MDRRWPPSSPVWRMRSREASFPATARMTARMHLTHSPSCACQLPVRKYCRRNSRMSNANSTRPMSQPPCRLEARVCGPRLRRRDATSWIRATSAREGCHSFFLQTFFASNHSFKCSQLKTKHLFASPQRPARACCRSVRQLRSFGQDACEVWT